MKAALCVLAATLALSVGITAAGAHNATIGLGCDGVSFDFTSFPSGANTAHATIKANNQTVFSGDFNWTGPTDHELVALGLHGTQALVADATWSADGGGNAHAEANLDCPKLDSSTATTIHDAGHRGIDSAPIGSSVHDSATVSGSGNGGTPTGTVTFTVYTSNDCTSGGTAGTPVDLVAGVADPSVDAVQTAGGISFKAHYNGSATYDESTSDCEPLTPAKLDSSVATEIHAGASADEDTPSVVTSADIDSTVHDSATVSGSGNGGTPTGTVTFTVYPSNDCTLVGTAGTPVDLVAGVAHPSVDAVQTAGGISFKAHYNGSATYKESTSDCEPLTPAKLDSSVATKIHAGAYESEDSPLVVTEADVGSTVHDSATVSGSGNGGTPTGTVTFTVYTSNDCTSGGTAGTPVGLEEGTAHPSVDAVQTAGGISFKAHYNGSATYNESTSACERLKATSQPSSPPPSPPQAALPVLDLAIAKSASPTSVNVGETVTWTITVTNIGATGATNVTVTDTLPSGVAFVSAAPSQGSCTGTTCNLGNLGSGASATITVVTTATAAGELVNRASVSASESESSTANNTATAAAAAVQLGEFKPPRSCGSIRVGIKQLVVGKRTVLRIVVRDTRGKALKGAKVSVHGAGVVAAGRTGRQGIARIVFTPKKTGVILISAGSARCSKRLGVLGVFQPPLTG